MAAYGAGSNAMPPSPAEYQGPRASQACVTCRKQKRKCSKELPNCSLCRRMNRPCDYSDTSPPPTSEDFNALRMKLVDLESRLTGGSGVLGQPTPFATPSSSTLPEQQLIGAHSTAYNVPHDAAWQGIQNRFPAIAFLDSATFKYGGISVPKPTVEIPTDVLELLGDGSSVQATITEYFLTVHQWISIVSQKRLTRNMSNPLWEAGSDLALLFLAMKLILSKPLDGMESSQNPIYIATKRFIALMEAGGSASLLVLQANILVTLFEYGQSIYPAAWMSAGWSVRYGNLLGINGHRAAADLLSRPGTWTETEERKRTWWGVLVTDRLVSMGGQGHILNQQEPSPNDRLPANDFAWDAGEMGQTVPRYVSSPIDDPVSSFQRLCQASLSMGKVLSHLHGEQSSSETARFGLASQLYSDVSMLSQKLTEESSTSKDFLSLSSPLALTFSALCALCEAYSCQTSDFSSSAASAAMQVQAIDGIKTVSGSIVEFAEQINLATASLQDLDRVSPIVMDALYSAASTYAWLFRESGDEKSQMALDSIRQCLRRLGSRWRNAAEYLRILEAQEFTYAVGSAAT